MKRRLFFKILTSVLGVGATATIPMLLELESSYQVIHEPIDMKILKNYINFIDNFIITNKNNKIKVFQSKCTHLGCQINNFQGEIIICPCHGSHFDLNGKVIKGPANKSLKELKFSIVSNQIIIREK